MHDLLQTNSVADIIVQAVLSSTGFIVPIAGTVGRFLDRDVDKCDLRDNEEVSMTTAGNNRSNEGPLPRLTKPSKMLSDSET